MATAPGVDHDLIAWAESMGLDPSRIRMGTPFHHDFDRHGRRTITVDQLVLDEAGHFMVDNQTGHLAVETVTVLWKPRPGTTEVTG